MFHQLSSQGHFDILDTVVRVAVRKLGKGEVVNLCNRTAGDLHLGAVDMGLKNNIDCAHLLQRLGAKPQKTDEKETWLPNRRRGDYNAY